MGSRVEDSGFGFESCHEREPRDFNSDIDIKILFSKVDSFKKKQLWTYNKNIGRQKWRTFKENQL